MKIDMVWPQSPAGYYSPSTYRRWGRGRSLLASLTMPTLAALTPPGIDVRIIDADLEPVDFATDADLVALSGYYLNWPSMQAIAAGFRRRGVPVAIGGPFATLSHDTVRPHADILFRGEAERTWPRFLAEFARGAHAAEYVESEHVDLALTPVPRWDLVPVHEYGEALVQTARGCPYRCDFCDVTAMFGRRVRSKAPEQVLAELETLYRRGVRFVMLADDNLTIDRAHAERTLTAIRDWNRALGEPVYFATQLSIDFARHPDLMRLAAEAGLAFAFVGIESSNPASLEGAGKVQNVRADLLGDIARITEHGIVVLGGMISGFDQDGPDIFERQLAFLQRSAVPIATCGLLTASEGTPLYERARAEGRLRDGGGKLSAGDQFFDTNLVPKGMSLEALVTGQRGLLQRVWAPDAYRERFERLMRALPARRPQPRMPFVRAGLRSARLLRPRAALGYARKLARFVAFFAVRGRRRLALSALGWLLRRPRYLEVVVAHLSMYAQFTEVHEAHGVYREAPRDAAASAGPPEVRTAQA